MFSIFKCLGIMAPEDTWRSLMFAPIHRTATFAILTSAGMLGGWLHSQDRLGYAAMADTSGISQILKVTSHSHFTFSMVGRASALPWYPAGPQRLRPDLYVHGRCDCERCGEHSLALKTSTGNDAYPLTFHWLHKTYVYLIWNILPCSWKEGHSEYLHP